MLARLFEQFLKEKRYLKGISPTTERSYRYAYKRYVASGATDDDPTRASTNHFVIWMRESLSTTTVNISIRSFNSFLSWLYEGDHLNQPLHIKQIKEEKKVIKTFSDEQLRLLLSFKPTSFAARRLHVLICLLIDTGIRIEEALMLSKNDVDMDNLLLKVMGKGNKERIVPMSIELRKVLYKFIKSHDFVYVFCTRHGAICGYHNLLRDFKGLCTKLEITGVRVSFHTLRHTFAYNYVKSGGNIFYLQRCLGHSSLNTTRRYVELQTEDLSLMHLRTSLLNRLR